MEKVHVNLKDGKDYNVLFESEILIKAGEYIKEIGNKVTKICIVTDTNVGPHYEEMVRKSLEQNGFEVFTYIFLAGEISKTTVNVIKIVEFMAEKGLTRNDLVVALGGGVCGDMAGFAASMYLRGIKYVQCPTSLLSMVDSSVGGKTAVDLPQGKNLCGAFHQPSLVLVDISTLKTLDDRNFSNGMAEVIKMGAILDKDLFETLKQTNFDETRKNTELIQKIIKRSIELKARVVEEDEFDRGERAKLNFGHTAGHVIETLGKFNELYHGEAVGIGMILIQKAGEKNNLAENGTAQEIENVLTRFNLPTTCIYTLEEITSKMNSDKKNTGKAINFIVVTRIGESIIHPVKLEDINEFFRI